MKTLSIFCLILAYTGHAQAADSDSRPDFQKLRTCVKGSAYSTFDGVGKSETNGDVITFLHGFGTADAGIYVLMNDRTLLFPISKRLGVQRQNRGSPEGGMANTYTFDIEIPKDKKSIPAYSMNPPLLTTNFELVSRVRGSRRHNGKISLGEFRDATLDRSTGAAVREFMRAHLNESFASIDVLRDSKIDPEVYGRLRDEFCARLTESCVGLTDPVSSFEVRQWMPKGSCPKFMSDAVRAAPTTKAH